MSHLVPFPLLTSLLHHFLRIINTHSNYPDLLLPPLFVLHKHLLVVSHRFLTRRTPSCPNINQQNFSRFMSKNCLYFIKNIVDLAIVAEWTTRFQRNFKISIYFFFLHFFQNFLELVLWNWWCQLSRNVPLPNLHCNFLVAWSFLYFPHRLSRDCGSFVNFKVFENLNCFVQHFYL